MAHALTYQRHLILASFPQASIRFVKDIERAGNIQRLHTVQHDNSDFHFPDPHVCDWNDMTLRATYADRHDRYHVRPGCES
jgi:hypothetical protein